MQNTAHILIVLILSAGFRLSAQTASATGTVPRLSSPPVSWIAIPAAVSDYMFRGVRLGGAALQPSLEMTAGNLVVGAWGSFPLAKKVPGQSDPELDLYASYTGALSNAWSFTLGGTLYSYLRAEESDGFHRATFEPSVALNYTLAGVRITPRLYYDIVLEGPTAECSAAFALPLTGWGTELDFGATVGAYRWGNAIANASPKVENAGRYWLVQVEMPFQLTANSKVIAGFAYTRGSANYFKQGAQPKAANPAAVGRGVFTVKYAFAF